MESIKKVLHIRRKSTAKPSSSRNEADPRTSVDSEVAAMSPDERDRYLKEFEEAEKMGTPKKGGFLDKLIERGNKKTEEQLEKEARERGMKDGVIR
ncbi:uncharacterized protein BDR25DRAFT_306372 [Lindgomyces ingoldianus]|uniref:Uncharacterized protein n=1 Tax=Lindgomyces ingoldianus TaxID=673940 RepID=A0ACB6QG03_9PLEO|nr:uncharacterized protein BDR25DRAFT_306372 [Lindgomyces ingoldianus]KAF2465856.1 hypothetical protein BDR25DRAFT_306372 [Lindgomyces ingoldianus]